MTKWGLCLALALAALDGSLAAEAQSTSSVAASGTILGRVTDPRGVAQAGVPVTITDRDGRFSQRVLTQPSGRFVLPRLAPGAYSVEVLLPTFLPFWKAPIHVLPGAQVLLDINLRALADSVEVRWPENPAEAREEWKWVLRSGAPPRHVLRFQEEIPADVSTDLPSDPLRGVVQFWAGNGSRSFASDPGLRTSFDVEYGAGGSNTLGVAGLAGWEQGTPAAGFRAAWNRHLGNETISTLAATVRQVFLPGEYWKGATTRFDEGSRGRLQSVTLGYEHESAPSERLRLHYGALVDSISIGDQITRWSPFGRVAYTHSDSTRVSFFYTSTAPRVLPSEGDPRLKKAERWLAIPQLSTGADLRPALEAGRHLEATWEQEWASGQALQAGVFYDSLSDVALSLAAINSAGFSTGLLRDPFSNRYFLSGRDYAGPGARASFSTKLGDSEVVVGYSYAEGLQVASSSLTAESPRALREMVRAQRGHSFSVKVTSTVPGIDTQVITSYRWIPRYSVVAPDPYDQTIGRTDPYVNVILLQPLPSPNIFPGQFQAMVDFSNLLAQGYLMVQTPDGGKSLLFPAARSFRGGFNFIF
ncbi:MAG: carboxypeptidase-like regulatory domain-containing protein [Terriglobia bacterium]